MTLTSSKLFLAALACCAAASAAPLPAQASAPQTSNVAPAPSAKSAALLERLRKLYPGPDFKSVRESAIPGVYEVVVGANVGYIDETGRYLIQGQMLDLQAKTNLSQPALEAASAIDVHALPLSDAIKIVRGNGSRVLYAFVDPECPFCKVFDSSIATMTDYTAYLFLFPLVEIHPDAMRKSIAIWCAADRDKAWTDVVRNGKPIDTASCDNPAERNRSLAMRLSIDGTPAIILPSGKRYEGGLAPAEISAALNSPP